MRILGIIALSLMVMACDPLIDLGIKSQDRIYTLNYKGTAADLQGDLKADAPSIFVDEFMVAAGLDQEAVLVITPTGEQLTVSGISWAAHPADMLRDFMVNSIRAKADMRAYGEGSLDIPTGCRLGVKLVDFQLNSLDQPSDNSIGDVVITMTFILQQVQTGQILAENRVSETTPVTAPGGAAIIAAFQQGTVESADQASRWLMDNASQCGIAPK